MLIDWHSHHTPAEVVEMIARSGGRPPRPDPQDSPDFGRRIGAMDEAGIDVQLVSQGAGLNADAFPPDIAMEVVRASNDIIAERVAPYAERLMGTVAVTYRDTEGSAGEVARMAGEGFRAVMLYANGDLITRPEAEPLLSAIHESGLPVFLHGGGPGAARPAGLDRLEDEGRGVASTSVADAAVADCVMRMIASGTFDRYPRLRVVIRSGGGGVPLLQSKMSWTHNGPGGEQAYRDIFRKHFLVDSANVDAHTLSALLFLMGSEGVVFGSDYGGGVGLLRDAVANVDGQPNRADVRKALESNSRALLDL